MRETRFASFGQPHPVGKPVLVISGSFTYLPTTTRLATSKFRQSQAGLSFLGDSLVSYGTELFLALQPGTGDIFRPGSISRALEQNFLRFNRQLRCSGIGRDVSRRGAFSKEETVSSHVLAWLASLTRSLTYVKMLPSVRVDRVSCLRLRAAVVGVELLAIATAVWIKSD